MCPKIDVISSLLALPPLTAQQLDDGANNALVTALLALAVLHGCGALPEFQSNRALLASSVPPGLR
jgi:hypothetical protein